MMLSDKEIHTIREEYVNGASQSQLAKLFKTSKKTIYRVVNLLNYADRGMPQYYKHRLALRKRTYITTKPRLPIIEIGCYKRQGKDTFANMVKNEFANKGFEVELHSFANAVKVIVADLLNTSVEELDYLKNTNEQIVVFNQNTTVRDLLIQFGNGKMKEIFGKSVWKDVVAKKLKSDKVNVITDFRFEEEIIPEAITVQVVKDSKECDFLKDFKFDFVIENNKGLEELKNKAKQLVNEIV